MSKSPSVSPVKRVHYSDSPGKENEINNTTTIYPNSSNTSEESCDSSFDISSNDEFKHCHLEGICPLEKPKKRWLREAAQEFAISENNCGNILINQENLIANENQSRPTVLVRANKPTTSSNKEVSQVDDWQGALALMELANAPTSLPFYTQL